MFAILFLLSMIFLIMLGLCFTPKEPKHVILFFTYKQIQWVPISEYSSRFITYAPSFILFGKLSLEKTPLNLGSF